MDFVRNRTMEGVIHMGTVLVSLALAAIVACIIRSMIRDKKNGKSIHCGGDCQYCKGGCIRHGSEEK